MTIVRSGQTRGTKPKDGSVLLIRLWRYIGRAKYAEEERSNSRTRLCPNTYMSHRRHTSTKSRIYRPCRKEKLFKYSKILDGGLTHHRLHQNQPCQGWGREFESHRPLQIFCYLGRFRGPERVTYRGRSNFQVTDLELLNCSRHSAPGVVKPCRRLLRFSTFDFRRPL